jgi:4-amino-4-deoxy-L-arabinose transferase-like glycosyltransferase
MLGLLPVLALTLAAVLNLAWLMISWQSVASPVSLTPSADDEATDQEPTAAVVPLEHPSPTSGEQSGASAARITAMSRLWVAGLASAWEWLWARRLSTAVVLLGLAALLYVLLISPLPLRNTSPGRVGHPFQGLHYVREFQLRFANRLALVLAVVGTAMSLGLLALALFRRRGAERSGHQTRAGLLVASICLAGMGQLSLLNFYDRPPIGLFLPALILLGTWAFAYRPDLSGDLFVSTWPRSRELLLLALALGVTIFARFYRLSTYPYGIEGDESKWTIEVIAAMVDGEYPGSTDLHFAVVPLSFYMQAPFHYLLGPGILSGRIAVACYSVLGSLVFYLLVRAITNAPVAWLATMLLAVSLLDVGASRLANVESHVKLWPLLALLLLAEGTRSGRPLLYGLSGTAVAAGLLTYETISPVLGVALLIMLYEFVRGRVVFAEIVRRFSAFVAPVLVVLPIVFTYQLGRLDYYLDYASGGNVREGNFAGGLWLNFQEVMHTLFVSMRTDFLLNRQGPLFNGLLLPWLVVGTVLALIHWRRGRLLWVVLFAALFFFPVPILTHAPLGRVYYPGLPAAYLLMAIGLYAAFRELRRALEPALRPMLTMLAAVGLILLAGCNLYIYFNEVFESYDRLYRRELYDMAQAAGAPDTMVYFPFVPGVGDPVEAEQEFIIWLGMRKNGTGAAERNPYEVIPLQSLVPVMKTAPRPYERVEVIWDTTSASLRADRDAVLVSLLRCYPDARQVKGQNYDRYVIPGAMLRTPACPL